jgi:pectate lyase
VILHNFQVNGVGESDTVHIFADSSRVWVDHLTSFDAKLGLVSVLQGSTDVTISNSDLMNSNFNMLLGASDADKQDQNMRVTIFRNWFKDSMQRMPHCRYDVHTYIHTYIHTYKKQLNTYIHTYTHSRSSSIILFLFLLFIII